MTRYVLGDLREVSAELYRRAAELTDWLDRVAGEYRAPTVATPEIALGDLACVQAVSAAAARLAAAAEAVAACGGDVGELDSEIARELCRWTG